MIAHLQLKNVHYGHAVLTWHWYQLLSHIIVAASIDQIV